MNIFVLDENPKVCARYHNNKHVVKMILETAQLLCSVHWSNGNDAPYKKTHINHPCSVWTRECIENYKWLCKLGMELCKEYTYRYNKIHKTQNIIKWCIENNPDLPSFGKLTKFALAMPDKYKEDSVINSYRNYYLNEKFEISTWKKRYAPKFMRALNKGPIAQLVRAAHS